MNGFGGEAPEVPHHVGVFAVGLRVSLLGVDEVWEFDGITDEEDGSVVSDHIPVALFGVEFDGESTGVTFGVSGSFFASDGGESEEDGCHFADIAEKLGLAVLGDVMGDFEVAVSAGSLGVDDSFGDSLPVEFGEFVDEVEVLEEDGTVGTEGHGVLVAADGEALGGGEVVGLGVSLLI